MENTMFRDPVDAMGFGWFMDSLTDPYFLLVSCLATPIKTFFKKVRSGDSGTHKYFCITKDQVTTMVVFLIPEDKERWGQDLHRTTDASVCVVTKDKKQKVMG